ncbi:MAG: YceD family protein [Thermovirgaceae bacterium]
MSSERKDLPRLDRRPRKWDCSVQSGQFERGRAYEFFWDLPLHGIVLYGGQAFHLDGNLEAQAKMQRQGERVIADIRIRAHAEAHCSRCLEKTDLALEHEFRYFYVSSNEEEEKATEFDEHTVLVENETETLDISDQIWETLVMAFPEKVLCHPDCKGLCPLCGCNRNREECSCDIMEGDPRFAVLAEVLAEDNQQKGKKGGTKHGGTQKQDFPFENA